MKNNVIKLFSRGIPHLIPGITCLGFLLPLFFLVKEGWFSGKPYLMAQAFPMVSGMTLSTLKVTGVAIAVALLIGGGSAWMITKWNFIGKSYFSVALCLPFAIPSYLLAGIYVSMQNSHILPFAFLNNWLGAGFIFGISLYPWIYLPLKALLASRARHYSELGETLGLNWWKRFLKIHFWLLLPTIGIGALLVAMETISDFGTVDILGVKTLNIGVHDTMFHMGHPDWAAQLSTLCLAIPILSVALFAFWRRRSREYQPSNRAANPPEPLQATPMLQVIIIFSLGVLLTVAFILPVGMLISWAYIFVGKVPLKELPSHFGDTLLVSALISGLTLILALVLNFLLRLRKDLRSWRWLVFLINLNYALPSVMLAIAVFLLSKGLPRPIVALLLSESTGFLVLAGCLRYLCFPFFSINSGLRALSPRLDDLCSTLNIGVFQKIFRIYVPLTRRAIACGALLVIVNMAKELTLSKVLSPFYGFKPLSVRLHDYAGMGMMKESALFSLCLILLVIYPIITLDRLISKVEK